MGRRYCRCGSPSCFTRCGEKPSPRFCRTADSGWIARLTAYRLTASGGYFAPGSKWADVALLNEETVAIRSDGTLWVSEVLGWQYHLVRFGTDSDWQSVEPDPAYSVILLKRNGTLWKWGPGEAPGMSGVNLQAHTWSVGTNTFKGTRAGPHWSVGTKIYKGDYPGLRAFFTPVRIGSDSDWARMIRGGLNVFAWKRNGEAWAFYDENGEWLGVRDPVVDNLKVKSFNSWGPQLWVIEDGTLWWHRPSFFPLKPNGNVASPRIKPPPELVQIGTDSDWAEIASGRQLLGLKTDGTVWKWKTFLDRMPVNEPLRQPPSRFGMYSDWIAVGLFEGQSAALAADGTLWQLPTADAPRGRIFADDPDEWLAPTDRPSRIINILDAATQDANQF